MSTSIISATNPHKGTTYSDSFAFALDDVVQAAVTNPAGGLITPCQVTLELSSDEEDSWRAIDSKRGGMGNGDGSTLLLLFKLSDYAGIAEWTHARLKFSGNTAQSQLGVEVTAAGDGATWGGGGGGGSGTVTAFSFVNANGFTGTVANPTTAPALTLTGGPSSGGTWLTPTTEKTADYTAAANEFVPVSTTINVMTITLPTAPADGTRVAVKHITGGLQCYINPGGSDLFWGTGQAYEAFSLSNGQGWIFLYHAATSRWYVVAEELPLTQLDSRYLGSVAVGRLPTTGLTITQHSGAIITPAGTSGTITMDLSLGDWQALLPVTGAFTLDLSNATVGQQFTVVLTQASSGGPYAVTWFGGIVWIGSPYTAPTMPSTASARLVATFKCMSAGIYYGWWLGNSAA